MDYGNYGFKDEMTKTDWRTRRINMEDSVWQQHWHLNDPGVVPNLVQNYAGSPTGILVYEGKLLPNEYQNQVIHADAGPNVVYVEVANNGQDYTNSKQTFTFNIKCESGYYCPQNNFVPCPPGTFCPGEFNSNVSCCLFIYLFMFRILFM